MTTPNSTSRVQLGGLFIERACNPTTNEARPIDSRSAIVSEP